MTSRADIPVFRFHDAYEAEDYDPAGYLAGALPILREFGWLVRDLSPAEARRVRKVLGMGWNTDLDETDTFPFFLLWALHAVGALAAVEGLDAQLRDWREWEETDHCEVPLDFLPDLPTEAVRD